MNGWREGGGAEYGEVEREGEGEGEVDAKIGRKNDRVSNRVLFQLIEYSVIPAPLDISHDILPAPAVLRTPSSFIFLQIPRLISSNKKRELTVVQDVVDSFLSTPLRRIDTR